MEFEAVELHRDPFLFPDGVDLLFVDPGVHRRGREAAIAT